MWITNLYHRANKFYRFSLLKHKYINLFLGNIISKEHISSLKLDIVIPAIEKDSPILPYVIKSIKKYIKHPLGTIFVLAPDSKKIQTICEENQCIFVNENTVLPIKKTDISYKVKGIDRSGWLFQQLLKLNADKISHNSHFLICDADTIFIRPQFFEFNNKTILEYADEYHEPYFKIYEDITGLTHTSTVSFVCHHMLFEKKILEQLKKTIETKSKKIWYKAIIDQIDKNEASAFSEYETCGNYLFSHYKDKILLSYWDNKSLSKFNADILPQFIAKYSNKYKTLSFHNYNSI